MNRTCKGCYCMPSPQTHSSLFCLASSILGGRSGHLAGTFLCKKAVLCEGLVGMGCWCFHKQGFRKVCTVSQCFLRHFCPHCNITSGKIGSVSALHQSNNHSLLSHACAPCLAPAGRVCFSLLFILMMHFLYKRWPACDLFQEFL